MSEQDPTKGPGGLGPLDGSAEPSALGASPSLPAAKRSGRRGRRDGGGDGGGGSSDGADGGGRLRRLPRPSLGPSRGLALIVVAIILLACVPLIGSSLKRTPADKVGISYGGGPIEGAHYQRIVQPGSSLFFNGLFDPLYLYPADQQNYIVSQTEDEGDTAAVDEIVAPSSDRVEVSYEVAVFYTLNTDLLREFHEEFGLKYEAFTTDGWNRLIQDTFRQQIENALQEETRRYDVGAIFSDAELLITIQNQVQTTLSERLQLAMGEKYFCAPTFRPGGECGDPTFVIKSIGVPDAVAAAFEQIRISLADVEVAENEVTAREVEARGIEVLKEAAGDFGSVYALLQAIEAGTVDFWVLPDGGLTLTTPDDPGGGDSTAPEDPATAGGDGGGG